LDELSGWAEVGQAPGALASTPGRVLAAQGQHRQLGDPGAARGPGVRAFPVWTSCKKKWVAHWGEFPAYSASNQPRITTRSIAPCAISMRA